MDLQKINVKFFVADASPVRPETFIDIFNSWIQAANGAYYDLADYTHVPAGPGVLLVAHEANVSIDNGGNRWGLLYGRKQPVEGSNRDKLKAAFTAALEYCRKIQDEPALQGRFRFRGDEALVAVNNRLLAPNTDETLAALRPDVEAVARILYPGCEVSIEREQDARRRFAFHIKVTGAFDVAKLIQNLQAGVN